MTREISRLVWRLMRRLEQPIAWLAVRACTEQHLQRAAFAHFEYPRIALQYRHVSFEFERNFSNLHITGLSKESGSIRGAIVSAIEDSTAHVTRVLLPGEYNRDKHFYADLFGIDEQSITTAGLGGDMDYEWDYEKEPPAMGTFDYIVSQAMLEHLLDPYRHVRALSEMLNRGGYLTLHTHVPGFPYHRYPIDCVRFFPDWFETVADRLSLEICGRHIGELRICYTFRKAT